MTKRTKITLVSIRHAGYNGIKKSTNTVVDKFIIIGSQKNIEDVIIDEINKDRKILSENKTIVDNGYILRSTYKIDGEFFVDGCIDNLSNKN
ncbi:MAG: hypothetical protein MJ000_09650 [Bacteroidales bacterium]|nr:hypothetical protein [Bacteroidales bacterium]